MSVFRDELARLWDRLREDSTEAEWTPLLAKVLTGMVFVGLERLDTFVERVERLVSALDQMPEQAYLKDRLLNIDEVAARWGVCPRTVESVVADEHLAVTYVRTARRFSPASVEAFERSMTQAKPKKRRLFRSR